MIKLKRSMLLFQSLIYWIEFAHAWQSLYLLKSNDYYMPPGQERLMIISLPIFLHQLIGKTISGRNSVLIQEGARKWVICCFDFCNYSVDTLSNAFYRSIRIQYIPSFRTDFFCFVSFPGVKIMRKSKKILKNIIPQGF